MRYDSRNIYGGKRMVDEVDTRILAQLQENARTPLVEVAKRLGMATSSVHERVRKLEARGVIRGYQPILDAEALGFGVMAMVQLSLTGGFDKSPSIEERLAGFSEIEDCFGVAGDDDYILRVRTRTARDLEALLKRINTIPGVFRTRTNVILSTYFERRHLPLSKEDR